MWYVFPQDHWFTRLQDMDSFASSILTAFFFHYMVAGQPVVPLINIPKSFLSLRADIVHVMTTLGIDRDWLLFVDDSCIENRKSEGHDDKLFLVDHNKVTSTIDKLTGNSVVGIIDHHADEKLYLTSIASGPRVIRKCGSCSSLVMNYWRKQLPDEVFSKNPEVLILALCPLLLDTSNMKQKVEEPDQENYEFLKNNQEPSEIKELYKTLTAKKRNLDGLPVKGILAKDYKEWDGAGKAKLGISTVPQSVQWLEEHHKNLYDEFKDWAHERQLNVAVMMTSFGDHKHHRQLVIWVNDDGQANRSLVQFAKVQQSSVLQLREMPTNASNNAGVLVYEQGNSKAGRKLVAPLLRQQLFGDRFMTL